jgi:hypothetical protein
MDIPFDLKTGFFKQEPSILRVDHRSAQIQISIPSRSEVFLVEFANVRRVIYSPNVKHELEIQTDFDSYVGYLTKESLKKGAVDYMRVEFEERFKEILY